MGCRRSYQVKACVHVCVGVCVCVRGGKTSSDSVLLNPSPSSPFPISLSRQAQGPIAVALVTLAGSRQEKRLANRKCQLLLKICRSEWDTAAMRKSGNEGREKEGREDVDQKNGWEEKKTPEKRCDVRQRQEKGWGQGRRQVDGQR